MKYLSILNINNHSFSKLSHRPHTLRVSGGKEILRISSGVCEASLGRLHPPLRPDTLGRVSGIKNFKTLNPLPVFHSPFLSPPKGPSGPKGYPSGYPGGGTHFFPLTRRKLSVLTWNKWEEKKENARKIRNQGRSDQWSGTKKEKKGIQAKTNKISKTKKKNLIFSRQIRNSYVTFQYRTSLNTKRILSHYYYPIFSQKSINTKKNLENKSNLIWLETRADIILFRAHWAKSITQAQHFLKFYFPSTPTYLTPANVIEINPQILSEIYKNKLLHLEKGNPVPNYLSTNSFLIKLIKNPELKDISFPSILFKKNLF